jgi:hypothetical protein
MREAYILRWGSEPSHHQVTDFAPGIRVFAELRPTVCAYAHAHAHLPHKKTLTNPFRGGFIFWQVAIPRGSSTLGGNICRVDYVGTPQPIIF